MAKIKFGADEYNLKATWAAADEFASVIGDPLALIVRAASGEKHIMTSQESVKAIWIGLKHAGEKFTLDEVKEKCFDAGLIGCYPIALNYLTEMMSNGPSEPTKSVKKKA